MRSLYKLQPCVKCKYPIVFLKAKNTGNYQPVNSETISAEEKQDLVRGIRVYYNHLHHVSHFATCKYAKDFRKKKKE